MADTATLRIVVDGTGAIVPTQRVKSELESLGVSSDKVQVKMRQFSTNVAFGLSTMASSGARDLTSMLRSLSSLGFAFGAQAGVITLAIGAIADVWSETQQRSKTEQEKMLADLREFVGRFSAEALKVRIASLEARERSLSLDVKTHDAPFVWFGSTSPVPKALTQDLERIRTLLADARLQQMELNKEIAKDERAKALVRDKKALEEYEAAYALVARAEAQRLRERKELDERVGRLMADIVPDGIREQNIEMDELLRTTREWVDAIGKGLDDAARKAERVRQVWAGIGLGAVTGFLGGVGGGAGSVFSGAVSAGVGAAAGGPWAVAAAGTLALVGGLFGLSKATDEAQEATKRLKQALQDTLGGFGLTGLDAQIYAIRQEFASLRQQASVFFNPLRAGGGTEYLDAIRRINEEEMRRIGLLRQEVTASQQAQEEAARLAALDAQIRGHERLSAVYGSAASTLTDYRNSLLLSNTQSPTARLTEARLQYDALTALVGGDDPVRAAEAAQRLPAAAQALLEASRAVNASGPAFQSDLQDVLDNTAEFIERFADLKSIEELQLEELRLIRAQGTELNDVVRNDNPIAVPTLDPVVESFHRVGLAITGRLDVLTQRVQDVETATRNVGNAIVANSTQF